MFHVRHSLNHVRRCAFGFSTVRSGFAYCYRPSSVVCQ